MDGSDASPATRPHQRRRASLDNGSWGRQQGGRSSSVLLGPNPIFRPPGNGGSSSEAHDVDHNNHLLDTTSSNNHHQSHPHGEGHRPSPPLSPASPSPLAPPLLFGRASWANLEPSERRASIKQIMQDGRLSQLEKRRSVQFLMDGRNAHRRSTIDGGPTADHPPYREAMAAAEAPGTRPARPARRRSSSSFRNDPMDEGEAVVGDGAAGSLVRRGSLAPTAALDGRDVAGARPPSPFRFSAHPTPAFAATDFPATAGAGAGAAAATNIPVNASSAATRASSTSHTATVPAVAAPASVGRLRIGNATTKAAHRSVEYARRAIATAPQCTHYQRNCHIVSPCCGATFGCRICHDECPVLPPKLAPSAYRQAGNGGEGALEMGRADGEDRFRTAGGGGGGPYRGRGGRRHRRASLPTGFGSARGPPPHHDVDRFAIEEIICRECFTKQSSKTNFCINCNVQFGEYHCAICNLWMSNEERPYHCPDCGFCRVGGGENFRHCLDCGMCIDRSNFAEHNCKVGKYMSNCPVCQEDLFSSRDASHELPCGHAIHWHCFQQLAGHDSRCPLCKKTAETHERMRPTWAAMATGIALQPLPPELCKVVTIQCNDCEQVQTGRSWHFLGVQCRDCESFNTVVQSIAMVGQEAHEFLLRNEDGGGGLVRRVPPPSPGAEAGSEVPSRMSHGSPSARRRRRASMTAVPSSRQAPPPPFG